MYLYYKPKINEIFKYLLLSMNTNKEKIIDKDSICKGLSRSSKRIKIICICIICKDK